MSIVKLNNLQEQVDNQITIRLQRICGAEWRKANILPNGRRRKKTVPVTYSNEVHELLELRNLLYNGVDPEEISATINNGEINYRFLNS